MLTSSGMLLNISKCTGQSHFPQKKRITGPKYQGWGDWELNLSLQDEKLSRMKLGMKYVPSIGVCCNSTEGGGVLWIKVRAFLGSQQTESWDPVTVQNGTWVSLGEELSKQSPSQLCRHVPAQIHKKGKQWGNLFHLIIMHVAQQRSQIECSRSSSTNPTKCI